MNKSINSDIFDYLAKLRKFRIEESKKDGGVYIIHFIPLNFQSYNIIRSAGKGSGDNRRL